MTVLGVGVRLNNALDYPIGQCFDAIAWWTYVSLLLETWTLAAPDAGWAMYCLLLFYWPAAGVLLPEPGVATKQGLDCRPDQNFRPSAHAGSPLAGIVQDHGSFPFQ